MKSSCDRCGQKTEDASYIFNETDQQDRKHRFGIFCRECTIELLDELKGKLEWFYIADSWRGYIHAEAKSELEKAGFLHPKHNSQYMEINRVGRDREQARRREALEILRIGYAAGLISNEEYGRRLKELREVGQRFS